MIYLITGVPGSGKTLYAVSTLIQKLAAEVVKLDDGHEKNRRVVVDGIKHLALPHELMAPIRVDEKERLVCDEGDSLLNWFDWCRPGDVIVVDEAQRFWRPRGLGTKPPEMIQALETHRHKGVDFVIITQNPMLIDQNVRRLVGRHIHVRRVLGLKRAILYDWDGCSIDVLRTKGATTSLWKYPKDAFSLYRSAELHTKQRQKIPAWIVVPIAAVVAAVFIGPRAVLMVSGAIGGKGVSQAQNVKGEAAPGAVGPGGVQAAKLVPVSASVYDLGSFVPRAVGHPESAPAYDHLRQVSVMPLTVGGYCSGSVCKCITQQGTDAGLSNEMCRDFVEHPPFQPYAKYLESAPAGESRGRPSPAESPSPSAAVSPSPVPSPTRS